MFDSLKEKIYAVVTDNASSLVAHMFKNDYQEQQLNSVVDHINYAAGLDILKHLQDEWVTIHNFNELNSVLAETVANDIDTVSRKCTQQHENISNVNSLLNGIGCHSIPIMIEKCKDQLEILKTTFEKVERDLIELEDFIETAELEERRLEYIYQLELYKQKKFANLEKVRSEVATKHAQFIDQIEQRQESILKERQQIFKAAFEDDVKQFKESGVIEKSTIEHPPVTFSNIQLECDDTLDEFLNN